MKSMIAGKFIVVCAVMAGMVIITALLWGCQSDTAGSGDGGAKVSQASPAAATTQPMTEASKSGAQLWVENCNRCHNIRDPATYSDAQWDVVMMHMRLRAQLTGVEYRKILEFLKTANKSG